MRARLVHEQLYHLTETESRSNQPRLKDSTQLNICEKNDREDKPVPFILTAVKP